MAAIPLFGVALAQDYITYERVVGRFRVSDAMITVRAKHLNSIYMSLFPRQDASVNLEHDGGRIQFTGAQAVHATSVVLANSNRDGADRRVVQAAINQIERAGTAEGFLEAASRRNGWRGYRPMSVLNRYRKLGAMNLSSTERLALEMSVHEETERRALHGDLAVLADAWRDADEIARICDTELTG